MKKILALIAFLTFMPIIALGATQNSTNNIAAAGSLTGSTLASGVTGSSLTSVGTLTNLTVTNPIAGSVTGSSATCSALSNNTANTLAGFNGSGIYSDVAVGSGLSLSGGSLTATGSGGTVTTTGSPASGNLAKFSGSTSIVNGDLSGDITTAGTLATTLATVNSNVGSFTNANVTVNAKGQVTAASNGSSSSGGLTVIASGNLSTGSPTLIDITSIPATYRSLTLYVNGASNTVATRALKVSVDTGLGLGNANNNSMYTQINSTTVGTSGNADVLWTGVTQTAAQVSSAVINFPAYQSGPIKSYNGMAVLAQTAGAEWSPGTNQVSVNGTLVNGSNVARTGAIVGMRITWDTVSTGTFDGGTYELDGSN